MLLTARALSRRLATHAVGHYQEFPGESFNQMLSIVGAQIRLSCMQRLAQVGDQETIFVGVSHLPPMVLPGGVNTPNIHGDFSR